MHIVKSRSLSIVLLLRFASPTTATRTTKPGTRLSRPFFDDRAFTTSSKRAEETTGQQGMMSKQAGKPDAGKKRAVAETRPSSSVLLISPENQILLLHRVRTSSAFPSAHVFPGGNCDSFHDGEIPAPDSPARHEDGEAYRLAAVRETFEESGILLARNNGFGRLIEVPEKARIDGRKKVHSKEVDFRKWLAAQGGRADTEGLLPFTRWITPTNIPKRFTTQMYIYFLPLSNSPTDTAVGGISSQSDAVIPSPTHDGGIEHTAARFLPPSAWISMAQSGEIILFPPQLFLLQMISPFLPPADKSGAQSYSHDQLQDQRQNLKQWLKTSDPPWGEKCMSPTQLLRLKEDGRAVLALDKPGPELEGSSRRGDSEHVVLVEFKKEGPRRVEVRKRSDVLNDSRKEKL